MSPDCLLGVVPQPTDSRLSETSNMHDDNDVACCHQVPSVSPPAGVAAVRTVPEGADERPVRQVHRRPAAVALAALPETPDETAAGPGHSHTDTRNLTEVTARGRSEQRHNSDRQVAL